MTAVAGIHFGNTNSVISVYINGRVETVSNETGDRITPSIIAFTGTEKVIGQPAKQYFTRNPLSCITNVKSGLEKGANTYNETNGHTDSADVENNNGNITYNVKVLDKTIVVSSVDATSYILTKLLEIAELVGGDDLEDVVIAVPHGYTTERLNHLRESAENIGFNVLRFISEPAAALLAYGIGQDDNKTDCRALVFRLGGTSMDATILDVRSGIYKCLCKKSDQTFGGGNFDDEIEKVFIKEFKRKYKEDISGNVRAVRKLKTAVETCKHGLSQMQTFTCFVESLYDGIDFSTELQRARLESICGHLFTKCLQLVDELLLECHFKHENIDKVILIGGGTRMPKLIKMFKDRFPLSEILNNINPDEAISNGAALQAGLLSEKHMMIQPQNEIFCISKDIGVKLKNDESDMFQIVVAKYTPVPFRKTCTLLAPTENKTSSVFVVIYERDSTNNDERKLAKIVLNDDDASGGDKEEFKLTFQMNRNGELNVVLSNGATTESISIEMVS